MIDRTGPRQELRSALLTVIWLALGLVAPTLLALLYVHRFGVNLPIHDEWSFMPTVHAFYSRGDWLSLVLEHYGEHRIVVPKLIILFLSTVTHLNVKVELYLSALLMALCVVLCWFLLVRTEGAPRWLILPIGWVILSVGQFANLLVGWQFQIPLMNVLALAAVLCLTGERLSAGRWIAALCCAFLATFCFANGLLVWPSLMVILIFRRDRPVWMVAGWAAVMILTVIIYRWGYEGYSRVPEGYELTFLRDPLGSLALFLGMLGNNLGAGTARGSILAGGLLAALLGVAGVILMALGREKGGRDRGAGSIRRRRLDRWLPLDSQGQLLAAPWFALLLFSGLSAASIAVGRGFAWESAVTRSQYLTVTVFVPVSAVVLCSLAARFLVRRHLVAAPWLATAVAVALALGAWQLHRTMRVGWMTGVANHRLKVDAIPCVLRYRTAPVECLQRLYALGGDRVREYARTLEIWGLGPFVNAAELGARDLSVRGGFDSLRSSSPGGSSQSPDGLSVELGVPLLAEGWAYTDDFRAPAAVILMVGDEWKAATARFSPRPDVDRFFRRALPLPHPGWSVEIPTDGLSPGTHRVQPFVLPPGSSYPVPLGAELPFAVTSPPPSPVANAQAVPQ